MSKRKNKTTSAAKFTTGEKVQVRLGVRDTDYPDMPLGGWKGVIEKVHGNSMYLVRWSKETLASIHPVFEARCENDGLDFNHYGLREDDIEPDNGKPLDIEQPRKITTKQLSLKSQDDRIRMIFGLTSNDTLPDVNGKSLKVCHEHLSDKLVFPFAAEYRPEHCHAEQIKVISLGDSNEEPILDEDYGIICEARLKRWVIDVPLSDLEQVTINSNRQLVADFLYWFHNWK